MNDERDEIRARIDLVDLVGRMVRLEKKGKSYKGLCPFHSDKNPSFEVNSQTGRYRCWSCNETGDMFDWVMKTQNVDFPEALRELAKIAGVTLGERHRGIEPSQKEMMAAAMADAQLFFREQLDRSEIAKEYCRGRGLDEASLARWGVGYAPDVGEALASRLKKKGFSLSECKSLFLVDERAGGGYYDKFRGRLMFPIWNEKGDLVAFGGRLLGHGNPKYINSSDTPLYRKSRVLYGMNVARDFLTKEKRAVLVEGYLDVIACHRAGVGTALASLGTSLSEEHAKLLKRWVEEVVILYDSDAAGQKAAERANGILAAEGLKVRIALMPDGEDPDTLLRAGGAEAVQNAVASALSPMEYLFQALEKRLSFETDEYWKEAAAILASAPSVLELDRHIDRLAARVPGISDINQARQSLRREVALWRKTHATDTSSQAPAPNFASRVANRTYKDLPPREVVIFRAFLSIEYREVGWMVMSAKDLFRTTLATELALSIATAFPDSAPVGPMNLWLHRIEPEEARDALSGVTSAFHGQNLSEEEIRDAMLNLKSERQRVAHDQQIRKHLPTKEERQAQLNRLREAKPDRHAKPPDDKLF